MISFALPWALIGLVAAGIPLFLHLVQRHEPREQLFPAVRYLEDATRDHRRRLQFRNLLLLILRTLLIIALVLAAAGATLSRGGVGAHAPSAMVVIVDNSASSATVLDGEAALTAMVRSATAVLSHATIADRLWLLTADGTVFPGSAAELQARIRSLRSAPVRFDLGSAVKQGRELVRGTGRPGEVVVLSDMQHSAVEADRDTVPLLVLRPEKAPPANHALAALESSAQPWGPEGGRITIAVTSSDTAPLPVTLSLGSRRLRDVLVTPGIPSAQHIGPLTAGWNTLTASLPPDEFRLDDSRTIPLRVAPPVMVRWDATDRYLDAAMEVLAGDNRIRSGDGVRFGSLGPGATVLMPPSDPAQIGAINRTLAVRNAAWRFGSVVVANGRTDSSALMSERAVVSRRVTLESTAPGGEVLATVDGAPWLVRSGNLLLLGSRLDPDWTTLPFSAAFVPFLDAILTRATRGEPPVVDVVVGSSTMLPERTTGVAVDGARETVEGGQAWRVPHPGSWLLLAGTDTLGGISATLDPRESDLTRASDATVQAMWGTVTTADLDRGPRRAFALTGRRELRGPLLALALCCALVETGLLGLTSQRRAA